MSKELEKAGLPVALISAMFPVAQQVRANRIVKGVSIPHPCGDPNLSKELDARLRREIIQTALKPSSPRSKDRRYSLHRWQWADKPFEQSCVAANSRCRLSVRITLLRPGLRYWV